MKKKREVLFPLGDEMRLHFRKMKLTAILLFIVCVTFGNSFSQTRLSVNFKQADIREVIQNIEEKTNYIFMYKDQIFDFSQKVTLDFKDAKFEEILKSICDQTNVAYEVRDRQIILKEKEASNVTPLQQQKSVSGKVTDSSGASLPGVSVVLKGTTTGVITDGDGKYSLAKVPENATLQFSFVGMKSQEIAVGSKTTINISLVEETIGIEEVVAVGYGTQKKSDITGAVASLSKERLDVLPNLNIAQAIQGSIPGVMVQTTTAGAAPSQSIMIRGRNSILASNSPLVVVDGIPYGGSLNDINPGDVKSIEILKDASSAAIYGSRGSNGVILVTTKEGAEGKTTITYDGKYSVQNIANSLDLMDGKEFFDFKMARDPSSMTQSERDVFNSGKWVNWLDLGLRKGNSQQHNLAISGSTQNTKFYISANYINVNGIVINDDFSRLTSRINVDTKITKWLTIGTRTQLASIDKSGAAPDMSDLFYTNPLANAFDESGALTVVPIKDDPIRPNPLEPSLFSDVDKSYQVISNNFAVIDFPFIDGLSYRLNTGISYRFSDTGTYMGRDTKTGLDAEGSASTSREITNSTTIENILTYKKTLGNHSLFATALYSYEGNVSSANELTASGFPHDILTWYSSAQAELVTPEYTYGETVLNSQMLRLNYAYASRYLLTLTGRRDGYSGFGASNKWGYFPSVAIGWNINNEKFFPKGKLFNELKVRFSFGLNGNQAVGAYETISRLSEENMVAGSASLAGYKPSKLGSDNLGWESSSALNFGVDFGIVNNRISGTFNLYSTNTTDLLLNRSISPVHGIKSITQNIGETNNEGLELSISSRNLITKSFSWTTSGNISFVKNKIVSLYGNLNADGIEIDDINNRWFIGQPISVNYDYVFDGVWQLNEATEAAKWGSIPGYIKIKDVTGDGKLTAEDKQIIGQQDPKMIWGLTNTFKYRNFAIDIFIQGVQGVTRSNGLMSDLGVTAGVRKNTINKNWWTPENPSNDFFMNNINAQRMSGVEAGIYESADFLRIKDISLSYDLPSILLQRLGLNKLKLYMTGRNLLTLTRWRGIDPELSGTETIPLQREFVFGLNLGF
jgi:TonB-linked SusC/RagA family outer membrane protein